MNLSAGLYRVALVIKWGGRLLGIANFIGSIVFIYISFRHGFIDFLATSLGCMLSNELICTPESKYLVFVTLLLFLITVVVWLVAEGIAWILEGFASDKPQ